MLVAHHLGVDIGQGKVGRGVFAAPRDDHLRELGLAQQGLHDGVHRQQLQVHSGIQLIENHRFVEAAADGGPGDFPGPLRFHVIDGLLLAAPDNGVTSTAQVIHQVGVALAQGVNGGVFRVALPTLEPLQDQHPVAGVLADPPPNGLERLAQRTGGLPLAFSGVDLDPPRPVIAGGLVLMGADFRMQVRQAGQFPRRPAAGGDDFHVGGHLTHGLDHLVFVQKAQVQHRIQLIQHQHRVETTGQGPLGNVPPPLGFLAVECRHLVSGEILRPSGAHLVNEMGEPLLQRLDGSVLVVGASRSFQEAQQQHPGVLPLTNTQANGAQHHPQGRLALALAFAVVDVQLTAGAPLGRCGCADADATGHSNEGSMATKMHP